MARMSKRLGAGVALAATAALTLAACGSNNNSAGDNPTSVPSNVLNQKVDTSAASGGTLDYVVLKSFEHLDPQRTYIGRDLANLGRTVYRSLVDFPTSNDSAKAATPIPDLATDTGTSNKTATQWKFTLKDGVKWQDGSAITCADLKYGVSRTFATDVITGGPNYILNYLNIPTDKSGLPIYTGPYKSSAAGIAAFNKAITCSSDDKTITYNFKKPWPDFPLALASLAAFDPYKKSQDKGDSSNFSIFSDGPYEVQGSVNANKGFTLVRNPNYSKSTDMGGTSDPLSAPTRLALPDKIVFSVNSNIDTIYDQLIADQDPNEIVSSSAPAADYSQMSGSDRAVKVNSPFVDYVLPNFNSKVMQNPAVRKALAEATNRAGWSSGLGGPNASVPASTIVNPSVAGYTPNPAFSNIPLQGDPSAALKTLKAAGVSTPVNITFAYPGGTPEAEKAAGALQQTWNQAGFKVQLNELPDTYYTVVQNPSFKADVVYGGWGADWPSISTVIPPLFDSRINISSASNGQDYGNYKSTTVNSAIDKAGAITDQTQANSAYAAIDKQLGEDTAYIPLDVTQFYLMHGSNVTNYVNSDSTAGYPDLGVIGLKDPSKS